MNEPTLRKPAGMLLLLLGLAVWAYLSVTLVEALGLTGIAEMLAYLVAGFAWLWLLPVKRLLLWMETGRWR